MIGETTGAAAYLRITGHHVKPVSIFSRLGDLGVLAVESHFPSGMGTRLNPGAPG
jgi:hypothetical protein